MLKNISDQQAMTKVLYLVSSGEHADYTPEAVFSTRKLAELAIAKNHQNPNRRTNYYEDDIEEIELDPAVHK